jgi:hypothetical protein
MEPHLPHGGPGPPCLDGRRVIGGILLVLRAGCRRRGSVTSAPPTSRTAACHDHLPSLQQMTAAWAVAGPAPADCRRGIDPSRLALGSTYVEAVRAALGGKGEHGTMRPAAGAAAARRRFMAWPMIAAPRLHLPRTRATSPTSAWRCRGLPPARYPNARSPAGPMMPAAWVAGPRFGHSERSSQRPPAGPSSIRSTARPCVQHNLAQRLFCRPKNGWRSAGRGGRRARNCLAFRMG